MHENNLVAGSLLLAVALTSVVSYLTDSLAVMAGTPTGFSIYLLVGIAVPQYILARRTDSPLSLGLAVFAAGGAVATVLGSLALGDPHGEWGLGVVALAIVVLGVLLGSIGRNVLEGYRSTATPKREPDLE